MGLWGRLVALLRLARRPRGVRAVESAAPPLVTVRLISSDDVRDALSDAEAGMDLAVDIHDWDEAVKLLDWVRQLRILLHVLEGDG